MARVTTALEGATTDTIMAMEATMSPTPTRSPTTVPLMGVGSGEACLLGFPCCAAFVLRCAAMRR